jgi:DNA recombination protein RmuC
MTIMLVLILGLGVGGTAGALVATRAERAAAARREAMLLRTGDVAALLDPLRDCLGRVEQQLGEVHRGRASSDAVLREQVRTMADSSELLRSQTSRLVTALRAPQVRGRWGEMQLERVVEAAGMLEHVDFVTQESVAGQRPDLVVHLTGGKRVVVDAKTPMQAYLEAVEAPDEATRDRALAAHARQLRAHIDALSAKTYWQGFDPCPEFVVCFVPADPILDAALRTEPELLERAFSADVVLATPATLVALLRTVAYTWRQEALAHNAEQVRDLGRELYKRLATMGGHVERLGRSLGAAVGAYNDTVGSMERMVFSKARQFGELGVVDPGTELRPIEPLLAAVPRPATAPEFGPGRVVPLPPPASGERDGRGSA